MKQYQLTKKSNEEQPLKIIVNYKSVNGTIFNETYIYLYDKLIARIDNDNRKFFYHPYHLGSTTLITNESGDIVQDISYLPFGKVLSGGTEDRFLQPDPVIQDVYNPQALNPYSYVLNNPYKYTDESGNFPVTAVVGLGAGAIVGVVQGYITYQQTGDLNKAVTSGIISGGATALTVATLGAASTTAVAGGAAARFVGSNVAAGGLFSGGVGAIESVAQQTLVQGKGIGDIFYTDVAISAGVNSIGGSLISRSGLPGVISRSGGTFYPSTVGSPLGKEIISQATQSGYSELGESGIKKLINDELSYVNNFFTPKAPINEEGGGQRNRRSSSGGGGSGGNFGSSTPPPNQNSQGGCGVYLTCL